MDQCGPLMVYDREFRKIRCSNEREVKKALVKLFFILRSLGLNDVRPILRELFRSDIDLPTSTEGILLPRIIEYVQPRFHAANFHGFQFIGGGGFGTVFRAEHRIDRKSYAIKVIEGIRSLKDLSRASSEVSVMANLRHHNVVQYITSWIEYGSGPLTEDMDVPDSYYSSDSHGSLMNEYDGVSVSDSEDLSSEYSPPLSSNILSDDISNSHRNGQSNSSKSHSQRLQLTTFRSKRTRQRLFVPRLFIQLELCNYNLAEWLQHRNDHLIQVTHPVDPMVGKSWWSTVPHGSARWLADQLVCGLAYLHGNAMMHRDLKPENVLLTGPPLSVLSHKPCGCLSLHDSRTVCRSVDESNCYHRLTVKICDFGLSRFLPQSSGLSVPLPPPVHPTAVEIDSCTSTDDETHAPKSARRETPCSSCRISRRSQKHATSDYPAVHHISQLMTYEMPEMSSRSDGSNQTAPSNSDDLLTGHLGSELYAAPEVRPNACFKRRLRYDFKADIYSMGVIFFQLFYPFFTVHELVTSLQEFSRMEWPLSTLSSDSMGLQRSVPSSPSAHGNTMKRSTVLSSFVLSWPDESRLVNRMLLDEPEKRPSAIELQRTLAMNSELLNQVDRSFATEQIGQLTQCDAMQVTTDHVSPPLTNHRLLDMVLWRNQDLEREVHELQRRLSHLESIVGMHSKQSHCDLANPT